jgi:hypothetical protein
MKVFFKVSSTQSHLALPCSNVGITPRSTFSWGSFLSLFAFKEGMLGTPISVLRGWPTVSGRFLVALRQERAIRPQASPPTFEAKRRGASTTATTAWLLSPVALLP